MSDCQCALVMLRCGTSVARLGSPSICWTAESACRPVGSCHVIVYSGGLAAGALAGGGGLHDLWHCTQDRLRRRGCTSCRQEGRTGAIRPRASGGLRALLPVRKDAVGSE